MRWPDKLDLATAADLGEVGIFGKKSITGMNRLDVANFGGTDDPIDHQVALGRGVASNTIGLVSEFQVAGLAVSLAVDRDSFDSQFTAGADDPQGALAAIGDQDALKHERSTDGRAVEEECRDAGQAG